MMHIAVATITRVRNPTEADLLLSALQALARHELPVAVADGGSGAGFLERLRAIPGVTTARPQVGRIGLVAQVQSALAAAGESNPGYIFYTEPDKLWFFENRLTDFLAQLARHPGAGILVPARDSPSFATFPDGQRFTESLLNQLCSRVFEQEGDYLYGPLLVHADLAPYVQKVPFDLGWGWRIYLLAIAMRLELGVRCWLADLPCPIEQRGEDDASARTYRIEQLAQGTAGLAAGLKVDLQPSG